MHFSKKLLLFLGIMAYLIFGTILFVHNLLPLKERLLLLGICFTLTLLFILGMMELKKKGAIASLLALTLMIGVEAVASYFLWSSMKTLDQVTIDEHEPTPKEDKVEAKPTKDDGIEAFHLFLSGKDVYKGEKEEGRSDVNLILTVNPKTHTILVTTVPRDSYMRIAGKGNNQYDKLTHAGIYGEETTKKTLENFFDIKMDYYAVVNFTSVIRIVDALGGLDVDNAMSFYAEPFYYEKGRIHLNGEETLRFARERYNLPEGELERGRNHVRIIDALIKKAISPAIIANYPSILKVVSEEMETNMSKEKIINLVNHQISDNKSWTVHHAQLQGFNSMGLPSYQMPHMRLFMLVTSRECARDIQAMMDEVLTGKTLTTKLKEHYQPHDEDYRDLPVANSEDYMTQEAQNVDPMEEETSHREEPQVEPTGNNEENQNSWEENGWKPSGGQNEEDTLRGDGPERPQEPGTQEDLPTDPGEDPDQRGDQE